MNRTRTKLIIPALAMITAVSVPAANAGLHYSYANVEAYPPNFADGFVGLSRVSPDNTQYIGCELYSYGGSLTGICFANDPSSNYLSCTTTDPIFIQMIAMVNTSSYIEFGATNGTCSWMWVENQSFSLP